MRLICLAFVLLFALVQQDARAQQLELPAFQKKIALAFNPLGLVPSSVKLSGQADWVAGSTHETGTVQESVLADGTTAESWNFQTVSHGYTQSAFGLLDLSRTCVYTDAAAKQRMVTGPNCLRGVPWFFPSFVLEPPFQTGIVVADATEVLDSDKGLEKLTYQVATPEGSNPAKSVIDTTKRLQKATSVTIYYDVKTALPSKMVYRQAYDTDEAQSLEVSVQFSDYSAESGFMIPHHIQRFVQRTLQLDFKVTTVSIR